jgi:hypothetical protein
MVLSSFTFFLSFMVKIFSLWFSVKLVASKQSEDGSVVSLFISLQGLKNGMEIFSLKYSHNPY